MGKEESLRNKKCHGAVNGDCNKARFPGAEHGEGNEQPKEGVPPSGDQPDTALPDARIVELTPGITVEELALHGFGKRKGAGDPGKHPRPVMARRAGYIAAKCDKGPQLPTTEKR